MAPHGDILMFMLLRTHLVSKIMIDNIWSQYCCCKDEGDNYFLENGLSNLHLDVERKMTRNTKQIKLTNKSQNSTTKIDAIKIKIEKKSKLYMIILEYVIFLKKNCTVITCTVMFSSPVSG